MILREYIQRILSLQKKGDYDSAYNLLQEALPLYTSNEFLQTSEIYLLLKLRRLKEARQKAETRLSGLNTNPFFMRTYIEILSRQRDRDEILHITERLKFYPLRDERLYSYLAGVLVRIGERERAIELLNSLLLYMPENKGLSEYLERLKGGAGDDSLSYYRKTYKGIPPEKVIPEIEGILVLPEYKENISIRLFLAEVYKKTGDIKRAEEVYSECLRIKDSFHVRRMLGFLYYKIGEMDKALLYLKEPFLENPSDHAIYNTISKIIEKTGNIKEIEALLNEALSKHPEARQVYGLMRKLKRSS